MFHFPQDQASVAATDSRVIKFRDFMLRVISFSRVRDGLLGLEYHSGPSTKFSYMHIDTVSGQKG
jgi:hypothetical protein